MDHRIGGTVTRVGGLYRALSVLFRHQEGPGVFRVVRILFGIVCEVAARSGVVDRRFDFGGRGHFHVGNIGDEFLGLGNFVAGGKGLRIIVGSELFEQLQPHFGIHDPARFDPCDRAVAVDKYGGGVALNVKVARKLVRVADNGESELELRGILLQEIENRRFVFRRIERVYGNHFDFILILLVSRFQRGELLDAPRTGGVPEIDHDHLFGL